MVILLRDSQQDHAGSAIRAARRGLTQHTGSFAERHLENAGLKAGGELGGKGVWFFSGLRTQ